MYAIIATGGKQYRVSEGDTIYIEKLENEVGDVVSFPVLMLSGETIEVGSPFVTGASVTQGRKDQDPEVQEQEELPPQGWPPSALHPGGNHRHQRLIS